MPALYPGSVRIFTTKVDLVDTVMASHVNLLQDEVTAIESTLGTGILASTWTGSFTNPSTHATVAARLINIEAGVKANESAISAATGGLVGRTQTQTLTNKTLTAPVISTIVNTGTLTLPTATDTLVGRATTDTLTNKTINGSNNTLSNIPQSAVTSLTTDLAARATLSGATFTGSVNVVSPTTAGSTGVRQITISTNDPSGGSNGDVWIKYIA